MDLFAYLPRSPEEGETIEANSMILFRKIEKAGDFGELGRKGKFCDIESYIYLVRLLDCL